MSDIIGIWRTRVNARYVERGTPGGILSSIAQMSRCVWALVGEEITEHMSLTSEPSVKQWIFSMIQSLSHSAFVEMVVTLWAIWYARRRLIHEGEQQSPLSTFLFVRSFLADLAIASPTACLSSHARPSKGKKWIAPPHGWVKINVDVATAKNGPGGAVAVVCRSEAGTFMGASTLTISGLDNPATLEAMACREALALTQDLTLSHICVASDCLEVIRNLQQPYMGAYSIIA
jgi:hypothetical protein